MLPLASRVLAGVLACTLASEAWAGPARTKEPPAVGKARELYDAGQAAFETADYDRAIRLWSEAYAAVPRDEEYRPTRAGLIYNIASARIEAYLDDHDLEHLRKAERLLEQYLADYREIHGSGVAIDDETARVEQRLRDVQDELARAESAASPASEPLVPTRTTTPDLPRRVSPLTITGGIAIGLAGAAAATMVVGLVLGAKARDDFSSGDFDYDAVRRRGEQLDTLAIVSGVAAGALLAAGISLLVLGRRRDTARRLTVHPTLLRARF
jgi:tetratricopeptide (TPR) repeat protein